MKPTTSSQNAHREATTFSATKPVHKLRTNKWGQSLDFIAVESPLEIKLIEVENELPRQTDLAVTMRTPGNDRELVLGFLYTEGIINALENVTELQQGGAVTSSNVLRVALNPEHDFERSKLSRNFYVSSSCGVCGKAALEAVSLQTKWKKEQLTDFGHVAPEIICALPENLRAQQSEFDKTGGLHAAARFRPDGSLMELYEDVGRHNALDKLIGSALMANSLPLSEEIICVSGRASFELVQKSVMAGATCIVAVGAPSSLAIELAKEFNVTLVGFTKSESMNVYSHPHRIVGAA